VPTPARLALAALVAAPLAAGLAGPSSAAQPTTRSLDAYGLTADNELVAFSTDDANGATVVGTIGGLAPGEQVVGIDFRPANDTLVGLVDGATDRLVTIDRTTAVATALSSLSVQLVGSSFGIDFNPTVDRLRVVSDADQNLRINVATGAVTNDLAISYAAGDVNTGANPSSVAAAYTNNDRDAIGTQPADATATTLYDIEAGLDVLVTQTPPNNGTLNTVGALGRETTDVAGLDIYSDVAGGKATTNTAYAVLTNPGNSKLYTVDLATGTAKQLGVFHADVIDLAVDTVQS
jgi:hypothetical protein